MTKLIWDKVAERFYEAGIDRGVLYLSDNTGVAWSGLTGLDERFSSGGSSIYIDGIRYNDKAAISDFEASLKAFTYPDEFLDYDGIVEIAQGFSAAEQEQQTFGLSYRSFYANDTEGEDFGYRIHIIYNLVAIPDGKNQDTTSESISPLEFAWSLSAVAEPIEGFLPTAHIILDSLLLDPEIMTSMELMLYGDDTHTPHIRSLSHLVDLVANWGPLLITPDEVSGLADLGPGGYDLSPSGVEGIYLAPPESRLVQTATDGLYILE